jgi:hypothetical protein
MSVWASYFWGYLCHQHWVWWVLYLYITYTHTVSCWLSQPRNSVITSGRKQKACIVPQQSMKGKWTESVCKLKENPCHLSKNEQQAIQILILPTDFDHCCICMLYLSTKSAVSYLPAQATCRVTDGAIQQIGHGHWIFLMTNSIYFHDLVVMWLIKTLFGLETGFICLTYNHNNLQ